VRFGGLLIRLTGFETMQPLPLTAVGDLIRTLIGVDDEGARLQNLVFASTGASSEPLRIFEAAHRALSALGPTLLALDDVQWFDERSLALVQYLLGAAQPASQCLLTVACARP